MNCYGVSEGYDSNESIENVREAESNQQPDNQNRIREIQRLSLQPTYGTSNYPETSYGNFDNFNRRINRENSSNSVATISQSTTQMFTKKGIQRSFSTSNPHLSFSNPSPFNPNLPDNPNISLNPNSPDNPNLPATPDLPITGDAAVPHESLLVLDLLAVMEHLEDKEEKESPQTSPKSQESATPQSVEMISLPRRGKKLNNDQLEIIEGLKDFNNKFKKIDALFELLKFFIENKKTNLLDLIRFKNAFERARNRGNISGKRKFRNDFRNLAQKFYEVYKERLAEICLKYISLTICEIRNLLPPGKKRAQEFIQVLDELAQHKRLLLIDKILSCKKKKDCSDFVFEFAEEVNRLSRKTALLSPCIFEKFSAEELEDLKKGRLPRHQTRQIYHDCLVEFLVNTMLEIESMENRMKVFRFFLDTASKLLEMFDYNGAAIIYDVISRKYVERTLPENLQEEGIEKEEKYYSFETLNDVQKKYLSLNRLFNPEKEYCNLNAAYVRVQDQPGFIADFFIIGMGILRRADGLSLDNITDDRVFTANTATWLNVAQKSFNHCLVPQECSNVRFAHALDYTEYFRWENMDREAQYAKSIKICPVKSSTT